jgi:hypothetical protein
VTTEQVGASPWAGLVTGIGSWPGTDAREAAAVIIGELPALPHLVELPARGLGADMIGRASALLVDMHLDATTTGYRLRAGRGAVARVAEDLLKQDLDAFEEAWELAGAGSDRTVKVQSIGPWTLAAHTELATGKRALVDRGAVRDLSESLAEGLARHAAELRRRLGVSTVVQLDEPALPAVLAGSLRGRTMLETVPAVPEPEAQHVLDATLTALGLPTAVHCCSAALPAGLLRRSAAAAVSFDLTQLTRADFDAVGELLDSGTTLLLGLIPVTAPEQYPTWRELASPAVALIDRLGFARTTLRSVSVTPTCGLANADPDWARTALGLANDISAAFSEDPESL